MKYDPEKHHRRSIRLRGYDYSQPGAYFVTICAQDRECLFGEIADGEMRLNETGKVVQREWLRISEVCRNVELDVFAVMPNHLHGIIVIVGARFIAPIKCAAMNQNKKQGAINRAPTVGEIVRSFKARCTHFINQIHNMPGRPLWQRNYHEHVIRDERSLNRIHQYIKNNPAQWLMDRENPYAVAKESGNPWFA